MTITTNIYRINNKNLFELVYICIAVEDPSNYQEARVGIPLNGSTLPLCCVCPKPGPGFPTAVVVLCSII
jgi:hypothetical protein